MRKAKTTLYFLAAALLAMAPNSICAVGNDPRMCHERATDTDAGLMHFDFILQTSVLPGYLQVVSAADPQTNFFELANGSKWAATNIGMVSGWDQADQLVITQNQAFFSTHRFALVNLNLGKATPINLVREARPEDSLYVTKLDFENDIVTLNNGQQWAVYCNDHGSLRRFSEHDRIILGANTSDCCSQEKVMQYLLIDTTVNQCVRATPLNH